MKVTVPVGTVTLVGAASECVRRARLIRTYSIAAAAAGSDAVTVAVKVTGWLTLLGFGDEVSAVLVVETWGGAATFCRAATIASVTMAVARALCSSLSDAAVGVGGFAMFALSKN
jgi:hypothetical protein